MSRSALIVAVVVTVAVGFVGLRFFGEPDLPPQPVDADRGWEGSGDSRPRAFEEDRRGIAVERRRSGSSAGERSARASQASEPGESRFGDDRRRDRGAEVIAGRRDVRKGTIGRAVGARRGAGLERSARIAERGSRDRAIEGRRGSDRSESRQRVAAAGVGAPSEFYDAETDTVDAEQEEEEGTLFDPLAPEVQSGEVDRGPDEDPLIATKVDYLEDGSVYVAADSNFAFPAAQNIRGDRGTIDMTIVPDWNGADPTTHNLLHVGTPNVWENRLRVLKNGESIRFIVFDNEGVERNINIKVPEWQAGERHQITASWDPEGIRLFLDGQLAGERAIEGGIDFPESTRIQLGSGDNAQGAAATYEEITVSSEPAPGDEPE